MNEFESDWISLSQSFVQNGWIQDGRIKDGCHHQINQIELVSVRVRVEWECFWVNLREDNKVSESKMAVSESNMADFKMAAIIKLSQNEWVKFFLSANGGNQSWQVWVSLWGNTKMAESKMVELKMTAIIRFIRLINFESESEWSESVFESIWEKITRCLNPRCQCLNPTWQNWKWLTSSSWVRMNELRVRLN